MKWVNRYFNFITIFPILITLFILGFSLFIETDENLSSLQRVKYFFSNNYDELKNKGFDIKKH